MEYHGPTKKLTVCVTDVDCAVTAMYYAIAKIRKLAKKPLTPYKRTDGALSTADHAMKAIIDAAKSLGIDLGARWGNQLDVSGYAN